MPQPLLSVIIPTHNNSATIFFAILDADRYLQRQPYRSELMVVDDASTDGTVALLERCQSLFPRLTVFTNERRRGLNAAVQQAVLLAAGDWRFIIFSGSNLPVAEFCKCFHYGRAGYDIFIFSPERGCCLSSAAAERIFSDADWWENLRLPYRLRERGHFHHYQIKEWNGAPG